METFLFNSSSLVGYCTWCRHSTVTGQGMRLESKLHSSQPAAAGCFNVPIPRHIFVLYLLIRKKIGRKGKVLGVKVGGWHGWGTMPGDLQTSASEIRQSIGTTRKCTCFVGITNSSYMSGVIMLFGPIKRGTYASCREMQEVDVARGRGNKVRRFSRRALS